MKRKTICLAAALILTAIAAQSAPKSSGEKQSVGLVLSGGGAKGIAHIGVIQALEENDIPIDYVTGTSMGAIVGGLYCAGYTPKEMLELILSKEFSYWSTGQIDPTKEYYFTKEKPAPALFSIPLAPARDSVRTDTTAVPASLISPLPMSFAFMQLFAPYNAQCGSDFNKLFVPFRCCASDVAGRHSVVLSKGDYADAIRSSMSFPIVFQPTEFEGMLLYDGGIYDNFPANVMKKDFDPDFVIGVDVSTVVTGPQTSLMDQLDNLVTQKNDYYLDPSNGIKIRFDLNKFGLLDFQQAQAIYKIGYDQTIQMIDSIKGRIHSRAPHQAVEKKRADFKSQTPQLRFSKVDVYGATPAQNRYIADMFTKLNTDTFGMEDATRAYYRAVSTGKLNDLQPHAIYNQQTGLFDLRLKASVKDDFKLGIGGYITSSTSSYVYLSAGYSTFSYNSLSAKLNVWLGQSYQAAMATGRIYLPTGVPSALELQAVASRRNYYQDENLFTYNNPSFVRATEGFGRLQWSIGAGWLGKIDAGIGAGRIGDSFMLPISEVRSTSTDRDKCHFDLMQAYIAYNTSTLDDENYPVEGHSYSIKAMGVSGKYTHRGGNGMGEVDHSKPKWLQIESVTRNYFTIGRHFSLGIESDIMLSTRKLLRYYTTSIVAAPAYTPTPASNNKFNPAFRANSFIAAGITPIYRLSESLSARISVNGFLPIRYIQQQGALGVRYDKRWFTHPEMYSELAVCYSLPFGTVSGYCNYATSPAKDWNVGVTIGMYLLAPRFLR